MTRDTPFDSAVSRRELLKRATIASAAGLTGVSAFSTSAAAQNCDAVVPDDYAKIQGAVDDASSGDTICIRPGTYTEEVRVDEEVTLRGQTPPGSGNPVVIDGWVSLDADGSELHRAVVTRTSEFTTPSGFTPDPFGVRVTASQTAVTDTVVRDLTDAADNEWGSINGIQVFGNESVSDVTIKNNEIRDIQKDVVGGLAGVKLQADTSDVEVTENTVTGLHSSGWAWGVVLTGSGSAGGYPKSVLVEDNTMDRINDGSEYDIVADRNATPYPGSAFGIDEGANADEATVRYNNLLAPNGAESKDENNTLVAECNWWGDRSGPTHDDNPDGTGTWALERGDAIDYTPWLAAPSPSRACVGGKNSGNGNGNGNGNANGNGRGR